MSKHRPTRRELLAAGTGAALGEALSVPTIHAGDKPVKTNVYETLGVKIVINAIGTVTFLGGSVMPPDVVEAWVEASKHFVNLAELQDRVGEKIAKLCGVEAALVTTGASGALLLGTAAAVTRGDAKRIQRLPDTAGIPNEVVLQKSHHSCYDNQLTNVGVKLIDVETAEDVAKAVSERTALMFFMNFQEPAGKVNRKEWVALAKKHKVPTLLDAAADTPPVERLSEYFNLGFDMVAFSGGKAIRGPNDTGLLLGRKEFIEAAKKNVNPHCGTIGRMMKVGKEDMVAAAAAVERFVRGDSKAEWKEYERRIAVIKDAIKQIPTIQTEQIVPAIANHVPHLQIAWDEKRVKTTPEKITKDLLAFDPPIQIGRVSGTGDKGILISVLMLQNKEPELVGEALSRLFTRAVLKRQE